MRLTPIRSVLVAAAVLTAAATTAIPVGAQDGDEEESEPCEATTYNSCSGSESHVVPDDAFVTGSGGGVRVELLFERYFDEAGTSEGAAEGYEEGCWGIRLAGDGVDLSEAVADRDDLGENGALWGNCDIEDTIDFGYIARIYWEQVAAPPPPTPLQVRPGEARVGVTAFLEIGGPNPATQSFATPVGTLSFAMTPRYVVSWGDGATSDTTSQGTRPGGGAGAITHTYTDHGDVTITVDAWWHSSWTLASASGDLPELTVPTSASLDLPVEQRQAIVD